MRWLTRFPQTLINGLLSVGLCQVTEVKAEKDRASVCEKLLVKEAGKLSLKRSRICALTRGSPALGDAYRNANSTLSGETVF